MKSQKTLNALSIVFGLFALGGFADALYLTVEHYLGTPIPCSIFGGCDVVTNSIYSHIGPVPIALLGVLYYMTLIIGAIMYLDSKKETALKLISYMSVIGFLCSVGFVYLQFFVIHAICLYCMISATLSVFLFIFGQTILYSLRKPAVNAA